MGVREEVEFVDESGGVEGNGGEGRGRGDGACEDSKGRCEI